jgi:uncharacterized damage-inducible protein DinB
VRKADIDALFDYNYWANRQVLGAADGLSDEQFTAPTDVTWRNIRGTLVHILDVERSWRGRIRGEAPESWDNELPEDDYPTPHALAEHWERDEATMRSWLEELDEDALAEIVDLGGSDRFPLWVFLLHIVTHGAHQRRDAAILLTNAGHAPPEIDFLYYADWLRDKGTAAAPG